MTDSSRGLRGGSWLGSELYLQSSSRLEYGPTKEFRNLGFRVATVPESSTYALILMAGAGWLLAKRRWSW